MIFPSVDRSRLAGPIGVIVAHIVIITVCVVYDHSLLSLRSMRGWITVALTIGAIYTLLRCALVDPGIVTVAPEITDGRVVSLRSPMAAQTSTVPAQSRSPASDVEMTALVRDVSGGQESPPQCVELRFCAICEVDQPLRAKHCEEINKCIRTFDHYCPWISNAVGEFNRAWFLAYLITQCAILCWFAINGILEVASFAGDRDKVGRFTALILAIAVMSVFLLMTFLMTMYHAFLCVTNMTTWEHSSWKRITYLKDLKPVDGSPFSAATVWGNVRAYTRRPGAVQVDNGGIVWRLGPQVSVIPWYFQFCCDI